MLEALRRRSFVHARLADSRVGDTDENLFPRGYRRRRFDGRGVDGADAERAGHTAGRHHACRVRGVPPGPRRFSRSRGERRRPGAGIQRDELRRVPQHPDHWRRRDDGGAPGRASQREWRIRDAQRVRRHAVSHVLGAGPWVPTGVADRRERVRATSADPAFRRRARRSDSR